jgi:transposase
MLDMITIRLLDHVLLRRHKIWEPGLALVGMSIVEQRYQAVLAVLAGDPVVEVAAKVGVSRQRVHAWLRRYAEEGLPGLQDRSHRPDACSHQASPEIEAMVCEMRRHHPKWGSRRIAFELGRHGCPADVVPSRMTVYRILIRHGLMAPAKRRRGRKDYVRWERDAPMELWQMDIVGGIFLPDGSEAKVVTGVDDHCRYCVIASVVLDDVTQLAQTFDAVRLGLGDDRFSAPVAAGLAERRTAVGLVRQQGREATTGPAWPAGDRRVAVEQVEGAFDVGHVRAAGQHVDRGAVAVTDQVMLGAGLAAVDRRRACSGTPFFASM